MGRIVLIVFMAFIGNLLHGQALTSVSIQNQNQVPIYAAIETNLSLLLTEFNEALFEKRPLRWNGISVTETAEQRIEALWATSPFRCNEIQINENLLQLSGGSWQMRSIPVLVDDHNQFKSEEVVINLTPDGKIDDLYFGIEQHKYKDVMRQGSTLKDFRRRQMILDFLENFRTAYNRQDLPLIETTFSENALIIVGKTLNKKADAPDMLQSLGGNRVELIRYNKQQYIDNLRKVFTRNRFIDVRFDQIEIVKHGIREDIYGVNLKQQWRSSTYGDDGYLFLMIDFENEQQPLIHVRAWQPQKDTFAADIIELGDFDIVK